MRLLPAAALAVLLALPQPGVRADAAEAIENLLEARWYEIEIIVFERLDVLDVNTSEQLTQTRARQWPANLLEAASGSDAAANEISTRPLVRSEDNPRCLGFPLLPEPEPPASRFLMRQEPPLPTPEEMLRRASQPLVTAADDENESVSDQLTADATAAPDDSATADTAPRTAQLPLTPYLQFLADGARFEQSLYATAYTWLDELAMVDYVKAINRQSHLRPLLHRRWRAPIPPREAPLPLYFASEVDASAPLTRAGLAKLEGHVSVTVGRYLHFAPTLWYHADNLGMAPIALPAGAITPVPDESRYMVLEESRRMRSGDLHYIDHPKLGVVVRIDPVAIPPELQAAWEALEAP